MIPQPIFVLASPRSFTSIVCTMLGQHPEAYGVPEINLLVRETVEDMLRAFRRERHFMLHGLLRTISQLYMGEQTVESVEASYRWLHKRFEHTTSDVFLELCEKVAPLRIVDKSPAYSKNRKAMERIRQAFPGAFYLYLTRHPKDQGKSALKAPQGLAALVASDSVDYSTDPPTIDPQLEWLQTQKKILDFLEHVPEEQQIRLCGESLLTEPQKYLELLCRRLNFSWSDDIYQQMLRTEDSPYSCMGPFGATAGNNPGFQKSPQFRYRPVKPSPNEGPLPWRKDGRGLRDEVLNIAKILGYQ